MDPRFVADCNVGKLARWLRMMGYDTLYFHHIDDGELMQVAMREERVVLTRDRELSKRRVVTTGEVTLVLVQEDDPKAQLRQVMQALDLPLPSADFPRCLECNTRLQPRTRDEVKDLVPLYVFRTQSDYRQCPGCHRVYWRGTHWQRMKRALERLPD